MSVINRKRGIETKTQALRRYMDNKIILYNSIGLSLASIAETLHRHPTTIRNRLNALGIEPADTRRAFMGDVIDSLSLAQKEWLVEQLGPNYSIKDFVIDAIKRQYIDRNKNG